MGRSVRILSATLSLVGVLLGAPTASADPRPWFRDGERRVEVERLGAPAIDAWGRSVAPVRLRYAGRDAPVVAAIDRTAIVQVAPDAIGRLPDLGARVLKPLMPSIGLWLVEDAGSGDGVDVASRLAAEPARAAGVRQAIPNLYLRMRSLGGPFTPNDPELGGQWYFKNLAMEDAWGLSQGDPKSTIVVVDGGCDLGHPDLAAKLDPGIDVADGDMDPSYDPAGMAPEHGTACAGIAGAATDNGVGIAGGCPACRLRCVRLTADKAVPISADVEAYQFALDVDAAVITNSWGFVDPIPVPAALADAINNVFDHGRSGKGAMVVFAAGNDDRVLGDDELEAVRGVLCVGAINNYDEQAPFTNSGKAIDLVAPTGTVTTDIVGSLGEDPGDYTTTFGGTSSACPVVAGISGLLVGAAPERTSAELYDVLTHTTRKAPFAQPDATGHDPIYGYGIVDPVAALRIVLGLTGEPDGGVDAGPKGTDPDEPDAEEGCGCEVVAADAPMSRGWAYLGLAIALGLRRRLAR